MYYVIFIDDFSRRCYIYFEKKKYEVFAKSIVFKELVENETRYKIKSLRSENGGEFVSNYSNNFMPKKVL